MSARPGTVLAGRTPFPYVNGGLFSGNLDAPRFTRIARSYLIHIGGLDWKKIDPDIFGSMIQAVAEGEERGALGMHYTSVPNILKVLNPLFLDDLRARLEEASDNARMLLNLSGMLVSACRRSRDTNEHTKQFCWMPTYSTERPRTPKSRETVHYLGVSDAFGRFWKRIWCRLRALNVDPPQFAIVSDS